MGSNLALMLPLVNTSHNMERPGADIDVDVIEQCPECSLSINMTFIEPLAEVSCPGCGHEFKARTF